MKTGKDYRIQILIRERGKSGFESIELKTEYIDDQEELNNQVCVFLADTLTDLEDEDDD